MMLADCRNRLELTLAQCCQNHQPRARPNCALKNIWSIDGVDVGRLTYSTLRKRMMVNHKKPLFWARQSEPNKGGAFAYKSCGAEHQIDEDHPGRMIYLFDAIKVPPCAVTLCAPGVNHNADVKRGYQCEISASLLGNDVTIAISMTHNKNRQPAHGDNPSALASAGGTTNETLALARRSSTPPSDLRRP